MLTRHFLLQSARQLDVEPKRISDAALAQLDRFRFPGNVRQLENTCHWLTVMAPSQVIETKDLPPEIAAAVSSPADVVAVEQLASPAQMLPSPTAADAVNGHRATSGAQIGASPDPAEPLVSPGATPDLSPAVEWIAQGSVAVVDAAWERGLEAETQALLADGQHDIWALLSRRFEARLIQAALFSTRGRRIEAAHKLGIGRNTITRKIQELGLE